MNLFSTSGSLLDLAQREVCVCARERERKKKEGEKIEENDKSRKRHVIHVAKLMAYMLAGYFVL